MAINYSKTKNALKSLEAWEFNPHSDDDPRSEHRFCPNRPVDPRVLEELGVLCWKIDVENLETEPTLEAVKEERGYVHWDTITVAEGKLQNYEAQLARFFTEHLHPYDESRVILQGGGFWDIRGYNSEWIRFHVTKGDMIVLPPGMFHRFTLDMNNYIKALLLFTEIPARVDMLKPDADGSLARKEYVQNVLNKNDIVSSTMESFCAIHLDDGPIDTSDSTIQNIAVSC